MLPSIEMAEEELRIAGVLNPGPWTGHSRNAGLAARNIAEKFPGMDIHRAWVCGMLHDIGRRVGVVDISTHVYEGYLYALEKGWDAVARICMTHSYLIPEDLPDPSGTIADHSVHAYVEGMVYDDYDLLIQLCDCLATDYGFVILEKRMVDVARRYGLNHCTLPRWERLFQLKAYFEGKMGCSIYGVLPDIGKTTLITPPLWFPPK